MSPTNRTDNPRYASAPPDATSEADSVPHAREATYQYTNSTPARRGGDRTRDRLDRDLVQLCTAALRTIRYVVRFAGPDARDVIADAVRHCATDAEDVADKDVTRADMLFDQLLTGLTPRGH